MTSVETVSGQAALDALAGEWDALVRAMPRPSPFLLHGWLSEWWRHYGDGARMAVAVAHRDGRLVGALPLFVHRRAGMRVASFLGGRQSVLPDVLLAPGEGRPLTDRLVREATASGCDVLDLYGLPGESRIAAALGPSLGLMERIEAPQLDLTPDWETVYRAKNNAKKRNLHRRRRRQLSELGALTVSVARDLEALEPALEEAFRLHALRWDGRPDGSGFVTPVGMRFHRAALRRLAAIDAARIVTLRLDGHPIAFHYYFALAGRMYVHRLAFDPALARHSPGLVNTLDAIEAAAEEGLTRVEFLGGGERYKLELADRFAPLFQGLGGASLRGRAYAAAEFGAARLRMRLKRHPRIRRVWFEGLAPARRLLRRPHDGLRA